jgi:hypothetical protein
VEVVGHTVARQGLLHAARERVLPVQDRDLAALDARTDPLARAMRHPGPLVAVGGEGLNPHARARGRPFRHLPAVQARRAVRGEQRVRAGEDVWVGPAAAGGADVAGVVAEARGAAVDGRVRLGRLTAWSGMALGASPVVPAEQVRRELRVRGLQAVDHVLRLRHGVVRHGGPSAGPGEAKRLRVRHAPALVRQRPS